MSKYLFYWQSTTKKLFLCRTHVIISSTKVISLFLLIILDFQDSALKRLPSNENGLNAKNSHQSINR